jgi:hypothetical protein
MTVQTLNLEQKEQIRKDYTSKALNITEIAKAHNTSTRTIGRLLRELDLATPRETLRGEAYAVMQVMRKHQITAEELETIIISAKKLISNRLDTDIIVASMMNMDPTNYQTTLAAIVHAREAKRQNVHVQTAMLNLEEKVNRNVRDNKAGRS